MTAEEMFEKIGLQELKLGPNEVMYDDEENEKLRTYASFNRTHFYDENETPFRNEIEMFFIQMKALILTILSLQLKRKKKKWRCK